VGIWWVGPSYIPEAGTGKSRTYSFIVISIETAVQNAVPLVQISIDVIYYTESLGGWGKKNDSIKLALHSVQRNTKVTSYTWNKTPSLMAISLCLEKGKTTYVTVEESEECRFTVDQWCHCRGYSAEEILATNYWQWGYCQPTVENLVRTWIKERKHWRVKINRCSIYRQHWYRIHWRRRILRRRFRITSFRCCHACTCEERKA
jgi:hypothetical protein